MTQIKRLLEAGVFATIILCCATSCSNDDNYDGSYTFDYIEWAMLADDQMTEDVIELAPETYENASNSTIYVTNNPVMDFKETSQFYYDSPEYFQLLNQIPSEVCFPTGNISFSDFRHLVGGSTVPFSLEEYAHAPYDYVSETTSVPPHCIFYYKASVIMRTVNATYRAYFTGNDSGKQVMITGKWKGVFYKDDKSIINIKEIK